MRPFLIPGTVSFAPDTGTPAFETVGASTVSFPGHTVPEGNETVPLIRNAALANTWSRAFETVTVQEIASVDAVRSVCLHVANVNVGRSNRLTRFPTLAWMSGLSPVIPGE